VTELTQNSYRDEWGVFWTRPESGGHFIFQEGPFQKKEPTLAELEKYPWPEPRLPHRIEGLKERAKQLHEETDYAVFLRLPYGIVWDCQRVRGFGQWLEDLVVNPVLAEALMDYSAMVNVGITEYALEEVGEYVDIVGFPDDLGFQDRPFMRPEVYRKMVKPYHGRVVDAIKRNTDAKVLMHNDGAIYPMIQDYIDIGVEVLNPVQVSAANMDSRRLKEEFGKDLSFWGAIDTGEVLPLGTPEDVRAEVKTRIDDLGPSGGYVLASVHNIQAEITAENIVAMFDSGKEYGRY
jgi:uroporphyrinogen decarboxylase